MSNNQSVQCKINGCFFGFFFRKFTKAVAFRVELRCIHLCNVNPGVQLPSEQKTDQNVGCNFEQLFQHYHMRGRISESSNARTQKV
ncbi:hypothetical protein TcWFU_006650 [Taenia crassiceps]|uniref:Uncharacterized protein n=1 Tax=Taenia crassiceps TaxID=6207 RepID=A0ABR4QRY9_9CEST